MQITDSIPIPGTDSYQGNQNGRKWPLDEMEIGDSFFIPAESARHARSAAVYFKRTRETEGWDYTTRSEGDGIRLWRVS